MTVQSPQLLGLSDGRVLAYRAWGDPAGFPVLEFRGLPSSGSGDAINPEFLHERGIRRITVDRPGMGFSSFQPVRTLLDWPADVHDLVDALDLGRFALLGTSGGGPFTAVCAYLLSERITRVALVSALGPMDRPGAFDGMNRSEARIMRSARRAPRRARAIVGAMAFAARHRPDLMVRGLLSQLPTGDRSVASQPRVRESLQDSFSLAFRQGARGQLHDWAIIASPWGFRPDDVSVPVHLYQGELDDRVPLHHAEHMAARFRRSQLTCYPNDGHMLVFRHGEQILADLTSQKDG